MFFKNKLKDLIIALELTKELEDALIEDGAKGKSLSDKIKSYQKYDEAAYLKAFKNKSDNERELQYHFREYKRSLLGGLYNDLRWVAHERNQLMHNADYIITDFKKFQAVSKEGIAFLKGIEAKKNFSWYINENFPVVFPLAIITIVIVFSYEVFFGSGNWMYPMIVAIPTFIILYYGYLILLLGIKIFNSLVSLWERQVLLRNISIIALFLIIFALWNVDFNDLYKFFSKTLQIWKLL